MMLVAVDGVNRPVRMVVAHHVTSCSLMLAVDAAEPASARDPHGASVAIDLVIAEQDVDRIGEDAFRSARMRSRVDDIGLRD